MLEKLRCAGSYLREIPSGQARDGKCFHLFKRSLDFVEILARQGKDVQPYVMTPAKDILYRPRYPIIGLLFEHRYVAGQFAYRLTQRLPPITAGRLQHG